MFDLEHWLTAQQLYDGARLLSKRSARLSLKGKRAFHKIKWGHAEKEVYFLKKEAVWLSRIEREKTFIQLDSYQHNQQNDEFFRDLEDCSYKQTVFLLLLEYIDGNSVSEVLKSPIDKTLFDDSANRNQFILSLLNAIDSLHGQGIVHGDIKASNVILTPQNTARIIDFASADWLGSSNENQPFLMKTLSYSFPENYSSVFVSAATDWYAFFILLDLVHFSTPVTLKEYDLHDYLKHHRNRIVSGNFERDLKLQLEKAFTLLSEYLLSLR